MESIIEELIAIIAQEIETFNKLLNTLHDKQRAIVEGEIEQLNASVKAETAIASETKTLEEERLARARQLARTLEMEEVDPKLSEIIDKVEKKYAQRLDEQRDLLRALIEKVQVLNQNNQFLLDYSLNFIEKSMELLLTGGQKLPIYQKDGQVRKDLQKYKVLDQSV